MTERFEIKSSYRVRTAFGEFYKKMVEEGQIEYQHQLFTYAFLIGLLENVSVEGAKDKDICSVHNINGDNLKIITGIALMKFGDQVFDGNELFKKIMEYADGGIKILQKEFEINGSINSLSRYL